jgi:hypothetical protein
MSAVAKPRLNIADIAATVAPELVRVSNWGDSSFINVPLLFPSGSQVTVKLDPVDGGVRVSDNGFAYRELEAIGAERSFPRTARTHTKPAQLSVGNRVIFVDVTPDQAFGAICDVAMASWQVADQIYARQADVEEEELEDYLRQRLPIIFADRFIPGTQRMRGASQTEWVIAGAVKTIQGDGLAVFIGVSNHHVSINQATAGILDLGNLENPPRRIAAVKEKKALGPRLALLSEAGGYVIEEGQSDNVYEKAVDEAA